MEEAKRAGVERVVYTTSVATLKTGPTGETFDETMTLDESHAIGAYKRSKLLAERLVTRWWRQGLPAIIVNPSTPVGPREREADADRPDHRRGGDRARSPPSSIPG